MAKFTIGNFDGLTFADNGIVSQSINAYGVSGIVRSVSITLGGLSHEYLDDLDMLLEAPDGAHNLEFWSDAGGSQSIPSTLPADITIADSGSLALPDVNLPASGSTYRPADYGTVEINTNFGAASNTINHAGPNSTSTFANAFG